MSARLLSALEARLEKCNEERFYIGGIIYSAGDYWAAHRRDTGGTEYDFNQQNYCAAKAVAAI